MRNETELRAHCFVNSKIEGDDFVGVKSDGTALSVHFPLGYYFPEDDRLLRRDVVNLITVLTKFSGIKDKTVPFNRSFSRETVDFPIQAYMNLMLRFRNANSTYYTESEVKYTVGKRGKQNWPRTIKNIKPIPQDGGSFVYLDYVVKETASNTEKLITLVHEYLVYESYQRIGFLFPGDEPQQPRIRFDYKMFRGAVFDKLNHTNKGSDIELFENMLAIIGYLGEDGIPQQFYFGTHRFEYVWERLIDYIYGISDKERFFPSSAWILNAEPNKRNAALEPDTIMIVEDKVFVLDAKYYRYGATRLPKHLPESTSINKQITYGEFIATNSGFYQEFGPGMQVYNAFLMPFGKASDKFRHPDNYLHIGEAIGTWKTGQNPYEHVQGILIDIRYLMNNYVRHNHPEIIKLAEMIEQATEQTCPHARGGATTEQNAV